MTEEEYWFWLCSTEEIWSQDIRHLLEDFGCPEDIFTADAEIISERTYLSPLQVNNLLKSRRDMSFLGKLEKMKKDNICFIYYTSDEFPERLRTIPDNPFTLFVKGNLPDPDVYSVGMVGARACSDYGREMAIKYATALAKEGIQVVSGMAMGIDSISAKAAMEAGGKTFAVLGGGVDVVYPSSNINLYYEIILNGGGIISEYPPGTQTVAWHFPHRNRIISGLSKKILIFEGRRNSGTLTTAGHALDQGVDIYALPGRVGDPLSEGCNRLIFDGAGMLLDVRYLLDDIYADRKKTVQKEVQPETGAPAAAQKKPRPKSKQKMPKGAGGDYAHILAVLESGVATAEKISQKSGIGEPRLSQLLCEMEIMGLLKQQGKDCYTL